MSNEELVSTLNEPPRELKRRLNARLLNMIAIGGSIGTGIFLASGNAVYLAGPGGTMLAYFITGLMVYFLMTSLGEMAAYLPSTGSFYLYATRYVDPALGYALGWNYWYNWAITVASEISAASLVMHYWLPQSSPFLWCTLFLGLVTAFNATSTRGFGEIEYWFSFIKICVVVFFIIAGFVLVLGIGHHQTVGFQNWVSGDGPFHGGGLAVFSAFMIAGFSFQGTELIGLAAGESTDPHTSVPKAIKQTFWRILLFFILSIFVITLLLPHTDPRLANSDVQTSPFTLVFKEYGITAAASLMNAVILVAILSAGNSGMYASTRMLWYLAKRGHVPAVFAKLNKRGIPMNALLLTASVALLAFLSSLFGNGRVYFWLLNASSLSGFIAWFGIAISHYRFRKAYIAQGLDIKNLPYVAKGYPFAPLLALALCVIIILGQNYQAMMGDHFDWYGMLIAYIGLPIFIGIYISYKIIHKTKMPALTECNLTTVDEPSVA